MVPLLLLILMPVNPVACWNLTDAVAAYEEPLYGHTLASAEAYVALVIARDEACALESDDLPIAPTGQERPVARTAPNPSGDWAPLVTRFFPASMVYTALCLIQAESGGDPNATNPSSGAAGLFQHLPKYWAERSSAAGWAGYSIYNPEANVAVAAWLVQTGGWYHWSPYVRGACRN